MTLHTFTTVLDRTFWDEDPEFTVAEAFADSASTIDADFRDAREVDVRHLNPYLVTIAFEATEEDVAEYHRVFGYADEEGWIHRAG